MKYVNLDVKCDQCEKINHHKTLFIIDYEKTILKSFWCQYCGEPQVIRFRFVGEKTEVIKRLEPSDIYVPKPPETGITIRPRAGKPRQG